MNDRIVIIVWEVAAGALAAFTGLIGLWPVPAAVLVAFLCLLAAWVTGILTRYRPEHADRAGLATTSPATRPAQSMILAHDEEWHMTRPIVVEGVDGWASGTCPPWMMEGHWTNPDSVYAEAFTPDEDDESPGAGDDSAGQRMSSQPPAPAPGGAVSASPLAPASPGLSWVSYRERTARTVRQSYAHGPLLARLITEAPS